jgi:hypothetical protein
MWFFLIAYTGPTLAEALFYVTALLNDLGLLSVIQAFIMVMMSVAFIRWLMSS